MGVMLLVFTPLPYMDATSSWAFRSRWQRAFVGAAGMITEIFLAGLAVFIWAYAGSAVVQSLAYNMMFIASVSTLLFNANPLLRFDGYYILSDLLDIPNLHTRSRLHLRHLAEHYLLGYRESDTPSRSGRESFWLTVFGLLSGAYRVVVFSGIILFVADKFLLGGLVMAIFCLFSWIVLPVFRFTGYLATSPRLARTRMRAVGLTAAAIVIGVAVLGLMPFSYCFKAPGIVESARYIQVGQRQPGLCQGHSNQVRNPRSKGNAPCCACRQGTGIRKSGKPNPSGRKSSRLNKKPEANKQRTWRLSANARKPSGTNWKT